MANEYQEGFASWAVPGAFNNKSVPARKLERTLSLTFRRNFDLGFSGSCDFSPRILLFLVIMITRASTSVEFRFHSYNSKSILRKILYTLQNLVRADLRCRLKVGQKDPGHR